MIDLTNSTRYYSAIDLKKDGIKYVKVSISLKLETYVYQYVCKLMKFAISKIFKFWVQIRCVGRLEVPEPAAVNEFVYEVCFFLHRWLGWINLVDKLLVFFIGLDDVMGRSIVSQSDCILAIFA